MRGYTASRFSFNTAGGRCDGCEGQGVKTHRDELPARRESAVRGLQRRALQSPRRSRCSWRGKSIGDVLAMSVDEAVEFFARASVDPSRAAAAAGRGPRLPHARPAEPDASGGEAQRIKLVTELAKVRGDAGAAPGRASTREAHALRARRADRRPAHGRRREADPRAAPPGRCRQHGGRDRAQPRRDGRSRLDHRPGPRRRRRRRPGRGGRHAGGGGTQEATSHTGRVLDEFLRDRTKRKRPRDRADA